MGKKCLSFRVGRVRAFLRGQVWYLSFWEQGRRQQSRVGSERDAARVMAAEINGQLEAGAPSALGFQAITFVALRDRRLAHHEHVHRSSLNTIGRYRTATEHLLDFVAKVRPLKKVSELHPPQVEEFIRFLRSQRVAPNGHHNARKRALRDSGVNYVLDTRRIRAPDETNPAGDRRLAAARSVRRHRQADVNVPRVGVTHVLFGPRAISGSIRENAQFAQAWPIVVEPIRARNQANNNQALVGPIDPPYSESASFSHSEASQILTSPLPR